MRHAFKMGGWRLALSLLVPTRFRSTYGSSHYCDATDTYHRTHTFRSTWWQHRGRAFARRTVVLASVATFMFTFVFIAMAGASDGSSVVDETAVVVPIGWLTLVVAPFLPIVTAWLARSTLTGVWRVGVTTLLSAVLAVLTTAINTGVDAIVSWATVITWLVATGTAMLGYLVLRKPVVDKVAEATPGYIG